MTKDERTKYANDKCNCVFVNLNNLLAFNKINGNIY